MVDLLGVDVTAHDLRDVVYRVRVEVVAELVDRRTGEVVSSGTEEAMRELYRLLKRREP